MPCVAEPHAIVTDRRRRCTVGDVELAGRPESEAGGAAESAPWTIGITRGAALAIGLPSARFEYVIRGRPPESQIRRDAVKEPAHPAPAGHRIQAARVHSGRELPSADRG